MSQYQDKVILPDLYDSGDVFLTINDQQNFKKSLNAVAQGYESIALMGDQPFLIDHYGQMLVSRLRKIEKLRIEVYFPSNTETLISRFNQILSNLSVAQAKGDEENAEPDRILVVHDFSAMNDRELHLMARIINDFPGAKTRAVLLLDLSLPHCDSSRLKSFGKNLVKWRISSPTSEDISELLKVSKSLDFEDKAQQLLQKIEVSLPKPISSLEDHKLVERKSAQVPQDGEIDDDIKSRTADADYTSQAMPIVLAVLVVSVLVLAFLYKGEVRDWVSEKFLGAQPSFSSVTDKGIIDIEKEVGNSLSEPASSLDSPENARSPVEKDVSPDDPDLLISDDIYEKGYNDGVKEGSVRSDDELNLSDPGFSNQNSVSGFLEGLSDSAWLLQHVAVTTYGDAINWRDQHKILNKAFIVPITSGDVETRRYVVVSGPFTSKREALDFLKEPGVPADYYLRTVRSLRAVIPATLLE